MILPRLLTPISVAQAREALRDGYQRVEGRIPTNGVLSLMMAQSSLETDYWRAMQHYNFGMIKGGESYPTNFLLKDDCGPDECLFRAYSDILDGATAYVRILKARPNWWNGLHTETAEGFNAGLITEPKYYTSKNTSGYEHTLRVRAQEFGGEGSGGGGGSGGRGGAAPWIMILLGVGGVIAYRRKRKV